MCSCKMRRVPNVQQAESRVIAESTEGLLARMGETKQDQYSERNGGKKIKIQIKIKLEQRNLWF